MEGRVDCLWCGRSFDRGCHYVHEHRDDCEWPEPICPRCFATRQVLPTKSIIKRWRLEDSPPRA